jgi:hypothetical protein
MKIKKYKNKNIKRIKNREELKNNLNTFQKGMEDEKILNEIIDLIKKNSNGETTWPSGKEENN